MYAMRTADMLASQLSTVVLERDIYKYRQRYPNAELDEIMRHVLKYTLPSTLPGTPRWHQQHLQDLLKMVDAWGMPHLFLTLTSDEMSSTRWPEIDTLEALLRRVHPDASFRDAPVECAQLFHARLWAFLTRHIILPQHNGEAQAGLLGRVQHYLVRYEVQARGSLHAHIILWLHPDDVAAVSREIIAYVPAHWDDQNR